MSHCLTVSLSDCLTVLTVSPSNGEGESPHNDLVQLQRGGKPMVGLALPLVGWVSLVYIIVELQTYRVSQQKPDVQNFNSKETF